MKTPDEIKKGLECDPLALIRQLHADNCRLTDELYNAYNVQNEQLVRINQLEAERDAAVRDLTEMAQDTDESCEYCEMFKTTHCSLKCRMKNKGFKWRGVQKEGSEDGKE